MYRFRPCPSYLTKSNRGFFSNQGDVTLRLMIRHIIIIIIIGFLINVQVQGQHPHQWAPFQLAGLLHAWQLTRSPGTSIMRVDSRELPLSAIPLCQLLPCHFGPPRPTLSINLYVKGCLDCTTGAFHMSIPSKSSLLQNEAQILNAKPHK